jgi:hypothetical protein
VGFVDAGLAAPEVEPLRGSRPCLVSVVRVHVRVRVPTEAASLKLRRHCGVYRGVRPPAEWMGVGLFPVCRTDLADLLLTCLSRRGLTRSASALRVGVLRAGTKAELLHWTASRGRVFVLHAGSGRAMLARMNKTLRTRGAWLFACGRVGCVPKGTLLFFSCLLPGVETPGYFILPLARLLPAWTCC